MPKRPLLVNLDVPPQRPTVNADMHLAFEIGVVLSGAVQRNHGAGWFHVGAGQAYASPSLQPHHWRFPEQPHQRLAFSFVPYLFEEMPALEGFDPMACFRWPTCGGPIGSNPTFHRSLLSLGRELASHYDAGVHLPVPGPACLDLMRLLHLVSQGLPKRAARGPRPRNELFAASRINAALELIRQRPGERISLLGAARACRMGVSTFAKLFKKVTGLTFAQFVLRWRLAHAAHLLLSTDWPIKTIADRFGFRYDTHFSRAFAAHYGLSPGRYRKMADH